MEPIEKGMICIIHQTAGLGNKSLGAIKNQYGSYRRFYEAPDQEVKSSTLPAPVKDAFLQLRFQLDPMAVWDEIQSQNVDLITVDEPGYPYFLRFIADPPPILYCRGNRSLFERPGIAIVGSRDATPYGKKIARSLAGELAQSGFAIISGMARGIDSEAHRGALAAGGKTVAILGCGVDVVYPRENASLYREIAGDGLVVSEFPWHTPPQSGNFPMRNRIIAGLSMGVVVVEAKLKSGALITVDFALEQGRDVYAVPGPITSQHSAGANHLIKQGAKLVAGVEDILEEYPGIVPSRETSNLIQPNLNLYSEAENRVLAHLGYEKCHRDHLIRLTGMSAGELSSVLLKLELDGIVQSLAGNYYVKIG